MDDPTRIFRGIKYAARFNFDFEEITWKYLNSSITQSCLKYLSPGRLKSEFISILREDNIKSALVHFSEIKIMDSLTDSSVNINRDFDCSTFKLARDIDKFAILFYKNGLETIIKISDTLQLGKGFAETCIVLGRVECLLHCEDEILYGHLFKNHIRLKDEVLNCLFTKYSRIQNYLRLKERVFVQKINTDNVRVSLRDEYLCTERAKHLIRLIKGGV
jgi:tRNA nucleotidyltransferase/poly(A) polymerase